MSRSASRRYSTLVIATVTAGILCFGLAGCLDETDTKQAQATRKLTAEAEAQIGMPAISNFRERRMMRMLYELRDSEVATKTYLVAIDNSLTLLCDSLGYGLPYATQFTNPQKSTGSGYSLPQAEPNGLFMPDSAEATWVMCTDPKSKDLKPLYVEQRVIVSPYALPGARDVAVRP